MSRHRNPARNTVVMLRKYHELPGYGYFHDFPLDQAQIIFETPQFTYYLKVYSQWFLIVKVCV